MSNSYSSVRATVGGNTLRVEFLEELGTWERRGYRREERPDLAKLETRLETRSDLEEDHLEISNALYRGRENAKVMRQAAEVVREHMGVVASHLRTRAIVVLELGNQEIEVVEGQAYLSPGDHYDQEVGQQIALERALVQLTDEEAGALLLAYVRRPGGTAYPWKGSKHLAELAVRYALKTMKPCTSGFVTFSFSNQEAA